jgi:hypothetical protein
MWLAVERAETAAAAGTAALSPAVPSPATSMLAAAAAATCFLMQSRSIVIRCTIRRMDIRTC